MSQENINKEEFEVIKDIIDNEEKYNKQENYIKLTCYSLIALRNDSKNFEYYFERSLEEISKKSEINRELLKASLYLSRKLHCEGFNNWTIADSNFCYIFVSKQKYYNTTFSYAKQCFYDFVNKNMVID